MSGLRAVPDLGAFHILAEEITETHIGRQIGYSHYDVIYLGKLTGVLHEEPNAHHPYARTFLTMGVQTQAFDPGEAVMMLPAGSEWVIKHKQTESRKR